MIVSENLKPTGAEMTIEDPFRVLVGKKGASNQFEDVDNNYILFMVSGSLKVVDQSGTIYITKADHMYAFSIVSAPYHAEALEDYYCVVLMVKSLRHHLNADNVKKIMTSSYPVHGVSELAYNNVIKMFIENLILLKETTSLNSNIYNIKNIELLHYFRILYSFDELARFTYGMFVTYSRFKKGVFEAYNNATSVQEMADKLFMTTKTFTRHFKEEFNTTPSDWIVDQKIYNLNHLISSKACSMSQVLEEFGFSSLSVFKQFCKRYNVEHFVDALQDSGKNGDDKSADIDV